MSESRFRVALTADFYDAAGQPRYRDCGLSTLQAEPRITQTVLAEHRSPVEAGQVGDAQGLVVLTPRITAESVANSGNLLAVGRFGVGYDSVDVPACTAADVVVFIPPGAVDRPVAEATVAWMLALTHHVRAKDALVRTGRWDDRSGYMGSELRNRTLGVVGLGGIGRSVVQLLAGFGMEPPLAFDPVVSPAAARQMGVRLVPLDQLLAEADFVSLHCPLTPQTRNLIGTRELALIRPDAYLINTARGGIVNEAALLAALREKRIAGAALDCFDTEPLPGPPPFAELDNVLLAPHCIAWTNELFRDIGRAACQGMVDLARGQRPRGVVNPDVFERPTFQAKWDRLRLA